jgi:hypothetical protein
MFGASDADGCLALESQLASMLVGCRRIGILNYEIREEGDFNYRANAKSMINCL